MKFCILIVGNDASLALALQVVLSSKGYTVTYEPDSANAAQRIRELKPDMVMSVSPTDVSLTIRDTEEEVDMGRPVDTAELLRMVHGPAKAASNSNRSSSSKHNRKRIES